MCRLALLNRKGIDFVEKNFTGGIEALFDCLEYSMGGHGNGIALIKKDESVQIEKGVKLYNDDISKLVRSNINSLKFIIYHTRIASKGSVCDSNCHPFIEGNDVLAMNGTESWVNPLIDNSKTDTETILKAITALELNLIEKVTGLNSVFLGRYKGKIFASKGRGDLEVLPYGRAIIFASEFPFDWYKQVKIYTAPKLWIEGEKINRDKLQVIKKKNKKIYGYSYVPLKYTIPWNTSKKDYSIYDDV